MRSEASGPRSRRTAACILAALAHVAGAAYAAEDAALAQNRALWNAAAVDDYEYGYNKYCECHREMPPETLVTVRDGEVVGVRHRPYGFDREVFAEERNLKWYWTVDGLFDLVAAAQERGAVVRVDYDDTLGYPRSVYIDYDTNAIGEELDVRLTRLERLSP